MESFKCPNCGEEIDKDYIFLPGAQSQYGNVEKVYEEVKYIITKVTTSKGSKFFVFEKDNEQLTQKWSFRLRNPDKVLKEDYENLDKEDKVLFTSDGIRIGTLVDEYPDSINSKLIKFNLGGYEE